MTTKFIKLTIILFFALIVGWVGMQVDPEAKNAEAKIFERLLTFTDNMPSYLFDDTISSKPIKVLVNGNTTWLTVSKTDDAIVQVLKFYQDHYQDQPRLMIPEEIKKEAGNDSKTQEVIELFEKNSKELAEHQSFVLVREHYGFLGVVDYKDKEHALGSEELNEAVKQVEATGLLSDFATGRVVIAMRGKNAIQTTVLNIWTGDYFSLNNLKKDADGNMPGFDIAEVPLHYTNKRELSIEQDNSQYLYRLVQYQGEGSIASHILFFHSQMEANGWKMNPAFEFATAQENKQNVMFYTKDNRECTIQVDRSKVDGSIQTTVIESTQKTA